MKIVRTSSQHSTLGEVFWYQRLPWFRLSIRVLAGLVGLINFAFPAAFFASGVDSSPTIRVRVNNYTQALTRHTSRGRTRSRPNPRQSWLADCLVRLSGGGFHR